MVKKSIFLIILLLSSFGSASKGETAAGGFASNVVSVPDQRYQKMQLTRTLFTLVLKYYFNKHGKSYDPVHQARREYYVTFLNEWDKMIMKGKYTSSQQIFDTIKARKNTFLSKHYSVWDALLNTQSASPIWQGWTDPSAKNAKMIFDYTNGSSFPAFLRSELAGVSLVDQATKILHDTRDLILINGQNEDLAMLIASAFDNSSEPKIQKAVDILKDNIGVAKFAQYATIVRDTAIGGAGFLRLFGRVAAASRAGIAATTASQSGVPSWLLATGSATTNPFLRATAGQYITLGTIVVPGGSLAACMNGYCEPEGEENAFVPYSVKSPVTLEHSLAMLWNNMGRIGGDSPLFERFHDFLDFKVRSVPIAREVVVQKLMAGWNGAIQENPIELFLSAEKLFGIDGREPDDTLAYDFAMRKAYKVQKELRKFKGKQVDAEHLDQIRAIIIDGLLNTYRRDETMLLPLFLGWGGNCQTSSLGFVGLLAPLKEELRTLGDLSLTTFLGHIEPVISGRGSARLLMDGAIVNGAFPSYNHRVVYAMYLRRLGVDISNEQIDALATKPPVRVLSGIQKAIRFVSDNLRKFDNMASDLGRLIPYEYSAGNPPEKARQQYSASHQKALPVNDEVAFNLGSRDEEEGTFGLILSYNPSLKDYLRTNEANFGGKREYFFELRSFRLYQILTKLKAGILSDATAVQELNQELNEIISQDDAIPRQTEMMDKLFENKMRKYSDLYLFNNVMHTVSSVIYHDDGFSGMSQFRKKWNAQFILTLNGEMIKDYLDVNNKIELSPMDFGRFELQDREIGPLFPYREQSYLYRGLGGFSPTAENFGADYALVIGRLQAVQNTQSYVIQSIVNWLQGLKSSGVQILDSDCNDTNTIHLPIASQQKEANFAEPSAGRIKLNLISESNCQRARQGQGAGESEGRVVMTSLQLIHMTLAFEEGIHLWNEKVVKSFLTKAREDESNVGQPIIQDNIDLAEKNVGLAVATIQRLVRQKYGPSHPKHFKSIMERVIPASASSSGTYTMMCNPGQTYVRAQGCVSTTPANMTPPTTLTR